MSSDSDDSGRAQARSSRRRRGKGRRDRRRRDEEEKHDSSDESDSDSDKERKRRGLKKKEKARGKRTVTKSDSEDDSVVDSPRGRQKEGIKPKRLIKSDSSSQVLLKPHVNDIMEGKHILETFHEQSQFLEVDFHDGTGPTYAMQMRKHQDDILKEEKAPLLAEDTESSKKTKKAKGIVYIESLTTGRFKRVGKSSDKAHIEKQKLGNDVDISEASPDALVAIMRTVIGVASSVLMFSQGILAGMATLFQYYALHEFPSYVHPDVGWIQAYIYQANEVRRFFFVFSTLALVAASNKFILVCDDKEAFQRLSFFRKLVLVATIFMYLNALICSILCSTFDVLVFQHRNDFREEGNMNLYCNQWVTYIFGEDDGAEQADRDQMEYLKDVWITLAHVRFWSCLVAWGLVCMDTHLLVQEGYDVKRELGELKARFQEKENEIEELSGLKLSELSNEEISNLVATQRQALEETQRVLNLRSGVK